MTEAVTVYVRARRSEGYSPATLRQFTGTTDQKQLRDMHISAEPGDKKSTPVGSPSRSPAQEVYSHGIGQECKEAPEWGRLWESTVAVPHDETAEAVRM